MNPTDEELVRKTLEGDDDAFESLVTKYQSAVYSWAFHILKNFTDAQDLAQESFIEAYFNLPTLQELSKFASWLRSITTNLCISWLRRQKPLESFEKLTEETSEEDMLKLMMNQRQTSTPDEEYERREMQEMVMSAIGKLSQRNQVVITMYYLNGLSYKNIADFLSVSESAVKSRLHRARNQLKEEIDKMAQEVLSQQHISEEFVEEIRTGIGGIKEELGEIRGILDTQFSLQTFLLKRKVPS
jgi:RNA polymerase sigma-70 factor (ECF subfamily)